MEPGVPPRGLRRRGLHAPRPDRARRRRQPGREGAARVLPPDDRRRHPRRRHRLRHCGAGQGGRQRLPGHEDLLHQRHGRGLRGHRRRRRRPRRLDRVRRPDRPPLPPGRHRLRRRLPAQGHPGLRAPGRRARGRGRDVVPAPRGRREPASARTSRERRPGDGRRRPGRRPGRRMGRGVQARQRRRPRLPGPLHRRRPLPARGAGAGLRPARQRHGPWGLPNAELRRLGDRRVPRRRPGAAPDRVARVPHHLPGRPRRRRPGPSPLRRPQRPRPRGLALGGLDRPRPRPPLLAESALRDCRESAPSRRSRPAPRNAAESS